jgi:hypothetical protein
MKDNGAAPLRVFLAGGEAGVTLTRGRRDREPDPEGAERQTKVSKGGKRKEQRGAPEAPLAAVSLGAGVHFRRSWTQVEHVRYGGVDPCGGEHFCLRFLQCAHVSQPAGRGSIGCTSGTGARLLVGREGAEGSLASGVEVIADAARRAGTKGRGVTEAGGGAAVATRGGVVSGGDSTRGRR